MKIFLTILSTLFIFILTSCENKLDSNIEPRLTLYCYGEVGSSLDSLYLSQNAGLDESVTFNNLKISEADIKLYSRLNSSDLYDEVGALLEYQSRGGVYYLPDSSFTFKEEMSYKIIAKKGGYDDVIAETISPKPLIVNAVINAQKNINLTNNDTLFYFAGESSKMITCFFDADYINGNDLLAAVKIIPHNRDENFWLEDTTDYVWENYDQAIQWMKNKKQYGKDIVDFDDERLDLSWYHFYHRDLNTIKFYSTDNVYRLYRESLFGNNSDEEIYSNVTNGRGLFSIWNSGGFNSSFDIFIKILE